MNNKQKKEHYVSNKEFLAAMIVYRNAVNQAKESGEPKPMVSNYIGECFLKIANHLSYRPNFINYTFRDDMISDGIENCLQYLDNFNPEKSNNPFAYFTQIIYYAFIRRIQKEKKQTIIKYKILTESHMDDMTLMPGEDREFTNQFTEFLKKNMPAQETESEKKKAKIVSIKSGKKKTRRRSSKASLEYFIN
jgi:DNA-directed RNA polymerase specialized sigma24 family protein|tara:strand:+ start:410 stop:985 length:576 start_codon:yes stop_codon:yes gene_type:complete